MTIVKNNIPEFTMPNPITEQDQIDVLEQRIYELSFELEKIRNHSKIYWNENGKCLHESLGLTMAEETELAKILKHWMSKYGENDKDIYREIITCPLGFSDKIMMLVIYSSRPKTPSPLPVSPEDLMKMLLGGKK